MKRKRKIGLRIFIGGSLLLLVGVAASLILGVSWLQNYLAGDEPRLALSRVVSRFLGVAGEFASLDLNLRGVTSPGFSAKGEHFISSIRADEISASVKISELINRTWSVPRVDIAHLSLTARPDRPLTSEAQSVASSPPADDNKLFEWSQQFMPVRFDLKTLSIKDFDLRWEQGRSKGSFLNARVQAKHRGSGWLIDAKTAQLQTGDALIFDVPALRLAWSNERAEIENMELSYGGRATFQVSGMVSPELDLRLAAQGVELGSWMPNSAQDYFSGNCNADAKITRKTKEELLIVGSVNFNSARLRDQPATISVPLLRLLWSPTRTKIENMVITHGRRTTFRLSGVVSPELNLNVTAEQVDLGEWIPREVQAHLSGNFNASAKFTQPGKKNMTVSGSVKFNDARLREHPAMIKVATFTRISRYRDLVFQVVRGEFKATGNRVEIRSLELESRGLLRVEGFGTIDGDTIDADLDVGVPTAALRFLPGAGSQVFNREGGGYRWARVKIRGPMANPDQDLVSRLINAPFNMVLSGLGGTLTNTLPNAVVTTAGGATQIIKGGVGLVGGAAKTITTGKTEGLKNGATNIIQGTGSVLNIFNPFKSRGKEEKKPLKAP